MLIWEKKDLPTIAEKKITEMANQCQALIYAGIDVELSDGTKHFSLEPNDQTNIDSMWSTITLGAKEYPYHADGEQCKMFTATDIMTLYVAYKSYVTQQVTYNNFLKIWINRETDNATIANITYGDDLPSDLAAEMQNILTQAQAQIQSVINSLTSSNTDSTTETVNE